MTELRFVLRSRSFQTEMVKTVLVVKFFKLLSQFNLEKNFCYGLHHSMRVLSTTGKSHGLAAVLNFMSKNKKNFLSYIVRG